MEEINQIVTEDPMMLALRDEQAAIIRDSNVVNNLVNELVEKCCNSLDTLISKIEADITGPTFTLSNEVLSVYLVRLPIELYFCSSELERQGIKEDLSKLVRTEYYNKAFQDAIGTVSLRASLAEDRSKKQTLIHVINSRAYKKIKSRIEHATDLASALKKILTSRIAEREVFNQYERQRNISARMDN